MWNFEFIYVAPIDSHTHCRCVYFRAFFSSHFFMYSLGTYIMESIYSEKNSFLYIIYISRINRISPAAHSIFQMFRNIRAAELSSPHNFISNSHSSSPRGFSMGRRMRTQTEYSEALAQRARRTRGGGSAKAAMRFISGIAP